MIKTTCKTKILNIFEPLDQKIKGGQKKMMPLETMKCS